MPVKLKNTLFALTLASISLPVIAEDDLEQWLQSEEESSTHLVNEGELVFLTGPQDHRVLQTQNWLTVTPASMRTGWVELHQCQSNLDPVSAVEVIYRYHGLRNLQIVSSRHIARVWVERSSVQLQQVSEGGEICINAEVQVLHEDGKGGYKLQSGPFHRRFLDGYYPVQLDYRIRWPADQLRLVSVNPDVQAGFTLREQSGELTVKSLFEGKLTIEVGFAALPGSPPARE